MLQNIYKESYDSEDWKDPKKSNVIKKKKLFLTKLILNYFWS